MRLITTARKHPSAFVLILANLAPLLGVLFLGAQLADILLIYWAETAIIGLFALLKAAYRVVRWRAPNRAAYAYSVIAAAMAGVFFIVHFSMFMIVHLLFLLAISAGSMFLPYGGAAMAAFGAIARNAPYLGVLALSHAYSFARNFVGREEWKKENAQQIMLSPYGRVIVMHITIIIGAIIAGLLGSPAWIVAMLVALKTAMDVRAHLKEHRKGGAESAARKSPQTGGL